jgi:hypothetical protein
MRSKGTKRQVSTLILVFAMLSGIAPASAAIVGPRKVEQAPFVKTAVLRAQVNDFLGKELAAHLADIKTLDPPPDRVVGALTVGEFSWGTFMRAVAAYADTTGTKELAGRDLAKSIGQMGLIESKGGGKAFSQLYAALSLRHFGKELKTNTLWQSLTPEEQVAWRSLLNPERFYDPQTNKVINLPENYLGVASRIASISYQLGVSTDRNFLDKLLDRAAIQFTNGAIYADDAPPTGRYDRYSNEYARYIWDAAETVGRKDILEKVRPSLKRQMQLWWDVVTAKDGYGYPWGRSQGIVSYLDTPEIASFLALHPEFRPAPLSEIAALYNQAWLYLRHDYRDNAHLLSLYSYGRGNYGYISIEREWQQTTGFFGKLANSHTNIMNALEREGIESFPATPTLPDVARFEFFRQNGDRKAGVWLYRQGPIQFALPITTGPKAAIADYLPAPFNLAGFAAPVEQVYPSFVPFIELEDGRTIVAADGADEIEPSPDGRGLKAVWKRWAVVGSNPGGWIDTGLISEVTWRWTGDQLIREETVRSSSPVKIRRWKLAIPTTLSSDRQLPLDGGASVDQFTSSSQTLEVKLKDINFEVQRSLFATGNGPFGKGVKGAIPLHLVYDSHNLQVTPEHPLRFTIETTVKLTPGK